MPGVYVTPCDETEHVEFTPSYTSTTVSTGDRTFGYTEHPSYPVTRYSGDGYEAVLDGIVYDAPVEPEVLVEYLLNDDRRMLRDVIADVDGSFVLTLYDEEAGVYRGLNDIFARLPLYYDPGTGAISREPALLLADRDGVTFDPTAVAQTILFRHPFGQRTPFDNVSTLPPGSVFEVDGGVSVASIHQHDFQAYRERPDPSLADLRSYFRDACRSRCLDGYQPLVSLSGGMDSRAVAAGFRDTCPGVECLSFTTGTGTSSKDADLARRIATALDLPHRITTTEGGERYRNLQIRMMCGMNSLHMASQVEFVEFVADQYEQPFLITGDGGDKVFPDLTPPRSFDDVADLVEYFVAAHCQVDPSVATEVTGVSEERIRESIVAEVRSYPEDSLVDRYVHLLFRNRAVNWVNLGEDRSRHFVWSDTPFYSPRLFRAAMAVSPETKSQLDYYTRFIEGLAEELTAIPDATFNAPIDSMEYRAKRKLSDVLARSPTLNDVVLSVAKTNLPRFDLPGDVPDYVAETLAEGVDVTALTRSTAMDLYTLERLANHVGTSLLGRHPTSH